MRAVNATERIRHPDSDLAGWTIHEVSTLVRESAGRWQLLWLTYFEQVGETPGIEDRSDFHYMRSTASVPTALGDVAEPWIGGPITSAGFDTHHDLSDLPPLTDCVGFTEPALFAEDGATYLVTGCIAFGGGQRRDERERLVLLQQDGDDYRYLGVLLDGADAQQWNADRLEQADLSVARDGSILLIVTPIRNDSDPMHQGCVVFTVDDLAQAHVHRDEAGHAIPRVILTADGNGLGPGLCTYDAASETGILLVITDFDLASDPVDLVFSLRATGVHP